MLTHTNAQCYIVIWPHWCEDQDKSASDTVGIRQLCVHAYINLVVLVYFNLVIRSRLHVSLSMFLVKNKQQS